MKNLALRILTKFATILSKILIWRYKLKIITVAGSVGKTSTKYILGSALNQQIPTTFQRGSFNQPFSIPFALFNLNYAGNAANPIFWLKSYFKMIKLIAFGYNYKIAVIEVGSDHPGDIQKITSWLKADYTVLTAVSEEHMANFKDLDDVAEEEFKSQLGATKAYISQPSVPAKFIKKYARADSILYGFKDGTSFSLKNQQLNISLSKTKKISLQISQPAQYLAEPFVVSALIMHDLKIPTKKITASLTNIELPPGRMRLFTGIKNSQVLDDTYNASPKAYQEALSLVYKMPATRRILVLGNMNEFGNHAPTYHKELVKLLDLSKTEDLILTLGPDVNTHLLPELKKSGAKAFGFKNSIEVGQFLQKNIEKGDLIFLKGSQNNVFLEEAVKMILQNKDDSKKLCRQSPHWLKIKSKSIPS
jgi:UDP-N-acetylmuramoyl-tripeptide--D-alanyl-D-alanine ligase